METVDQSVNRVGRKGSLELWEPKSDLRVCSVHFESDEDRAGARANTYSDSEMSSVVEAALSAEDLNGDGYIEYWEFMTSKANKREPKLPGSVEQAV